MLAGTLLTSSCKKQPTADFTVSDNKPIVDQVLTFNNKTLDGFSYEWDFGDGATSTEENPTHAYTEFGIYPVQLKAFSKNRGKSSEYILNLEVAATTKSKMLGPWDYDSVSTIKYVNGVFDSKTVTHLDQLFNPHKIDFKEDFTYVAQYNSDFTFGDWAVVQDDFSIRIDSDTAIIETLSDVYFEFTSTDTATVGANFNLIYTIGYLSRWKGIIILQIVPL